MLDDIKIKASGSNRQNGFTIIELMFAMTFIAFIMLFTVLVLVQMMNMYNKGVAMSQINQTGRQLGDDLSAQARFSSSDSVVYNQSSRRLCVGGFSYLWNMDSDRSDASTVRNYFNGESGDAKKTTRLGLVKISDSSSEYCSNTSKMPNSNQSGMVILSGRNVSILEFAVDVPSADSFISVHMVLATPGANKPVLSGGVWKCLGSGGGNDSNPYCAFGEFNNLVYMRGE